MQASLLHSKGANIKYTQQECTPLRITMEHVSEVAVTAKQPEIPGQSISKVHLTQKNANTVSLRRQGVVISAMSLDVYTAQLGCTSGRSQ